MSRAIPEGYIKWNLCGICSNFLYKRIHCGYSFALLRQVYKSICCGYSSELSRQVYNCNSDEYPQHMLLRRSRFRPVWSDSSLDAFWIAKNAQFFSCGKRRLWLDCANAQSDLSLRWTNMCFLTLGFIQRRCPHFHIIFTLYTLQGMSCMIFVCTIGPKVSSSRKHAYIILTPLNPTFI